MTDRYRDLYVAGSTSRVHYADQRADRRAQRAEAARLNNEPDRREQCIAEARKRRMVLEAMERREKERSNP